MPRTVALVTLGCARNEVDSEELAARLDRDGWVLVDDTDRADAVVVNTCGFIESAKRDSIDTLLAAHDGGTKVVAVGCLAERYGERLARELPEGDAVLGFDDYGDISARLDDVLDGRPLVSHEPRDRRTLLPLTPVQRPAVARDLTVPGHSPPWLAEPLRRRLTSGPVAPLKLASGCDRRCAFCAIPSFRGAYVSRPPEEILADAEWLSRQGVRELFLVSENSSSYGKDLGDIRALERLLPQLASVAGIDRVRVSYLQPAEVRPSLVEVMATTPGVAAYFDVSFQHASEPLLRRMRRFGSRPRFLNLVADIRAAAPAAGIRSNVIVGFPGETKADVAELKAFLVDARLDAVGVFGYSDEEGTEAAGLDRKVRRDVVTRRVATLTTLVDEIVVQRAEDRVGETVRVLVEEVQDGVAEGRAEHQGPEVDGTVRLTCPAAVGDLVTARGVGTDGVALVASPEGSSDGPRRTVPA